ncbi:hypothetical protein CC78DRAFT_266630 [Lojkania enalia]|uniref:Uncharacterized protein n=1 Tax=Lojkania enalia TaxID=147567 RepID=A0A9P4N3N5_9PLEO|nr:hypothetical protein CC78DRAFT_266630 [Didymosphaeria enalia]
MIKLDLNRLAHSWVFLLLGLAFYVFRKIRQGEISKTPLTNTSKKKGATYSEELYYRIETLKDFDLEKTEPIKIRPFKSKYHLTMSIENTTMSDLVAMDNTYRERITLRKKLLNEQPQDVLACNPKAEPASLEFYEWMITTYLPQRFPTLFTLSSTGLKNQITSSTLPLTPSSASEALSLIGENVDDDFLFLLPSHKPEHEGKYVLEAFITCFPSGFSTPAKLNLKLADIHGPVPGYAQKLEMSMDRFFASLPVGKIVKRHNWSITTHRRLFTFDGNHLTEDEIANGAGKEEVDVEQCVLRCERQTLHRLPRSGALVFAFKTYQYGLKEVRDEGLGEPLCEAIDGLGRGNVPGMMVYKRGVQWGERVKRFLRGED